MDDTKKIYRLIEELRQYSFDAGVVHSNRYPSSPEYKDARRDMMDAKKRLADAIEKAIGGAP
jgi:hypothetical protein